MKLLTYSSALVLIGALPATADINFSLGSGGLKATDTEHDIKFKMGGRLQLDYSKIQNDLEETKNQTIEDEFSVRRARIYMSGQIQDWAFKAQFNIDGGKNSGKPEDLYIQYKGFGKVAKVTFGKQTEPFSLEDMESSKDISILERSAIIEAYVPGRNYGLNVSGNWGYGVYSVGVYNNSEDGVEDKALHEPSLTARFVYNPLDTDNQVVHLGVSYSQRASDISLQGLELGTSLGAFHAQGEYLRMEDNADGEDLDKDGYYLQAGYVLTQEHRGYKNGVFKRIKPASNAGAWELVARYESGYGKYSDFGLEKAEGSAYTLGVNWYANNNVRAGLDYGRATLKDTNENGTSLRLRTQLVW